MKADRERRELKFELTAQEKRAQVRRVVCGDGAMTTSEERTDCSPAD